jgi:hypothetical protein
MENSVKTLYGYVATKNGITDIDVRYNAGYWIKGVAIGLHMKGWNVSILRYKADNSDVVKKAMSEGKVHECCAIDDFWDWVTEADLTHCNPNMYW